MTNGRVWFAAGVTHDLEIVACESAEAFQAWLGENHAVSPGIWLKLRKKGPGIVALDYAQALDVALCYGWIDGQKAKFDDQWWLLVRRAPEAGPMPRNLQTTGPQGPAGLGAAQRDAAAVRY
ncbi:YdeI/OmpD-associated family protein, partial [Streptomyces chiangmaiensis]|nr:hypothetical protein [Streptomyces chiangmaiensis]